MDHIVTLSHGHVVTLSHCHIVTLSHCHNAESYLMVWQNAFVFQSMHVAVNLPLQVRHPPAPVDQEEANRQDDLKASSEKIPNVKHSSLV